MVIKIAEKAKAASFKLNQVSINEIDNLLKEIALEISNNKEKIIAANKIDVANAIEKEMSQVLIDRLTLNEQRLDGIVSSLLEVVELTSPIGDSDYNKTLNNGLNISAVKVPLGVVAMIYEARPNVTIEALSLCLKTKNCVILRGSYSTIHTNRLLIDIVNQVAAKNNFIKDFVQLLDSDNYSDVDELVTLNEYIDVVIPRGGAGLINSVIKKASVPVIETGVGNNFMYLDESANIDMAIEIIINAKVQRPSVCNSLEKVLVDKKVSNEFYLKLAEEINKHEVLVKTKDTFKVYFAKSADFTSDDYSIEYLDYIIGLVEVKDLDEAISIINQYSSKHSNIIVSNNFNNIEKFSAEVDCACLFVNASSRFADGQQLGFGAEIGISTQKIHARGPMGLEALTTVKNIVIGNGQVRK